MMEITTSRDQVVEEELSDQEEVRENVFFKGCWVKFKNLIIVFF